ncbi:MAG: hypothetical protein ACI4SR_00915 [Faecalibacillus sp.]
MRWIKETNENLKDMLENLDNLIKIPSVISRQEKDAPFGINCQKALNYILNLGNQFGFKIHNYDGYAGTIEYGEGNESVGIFTHLDVVPAGEGWTKELFHLTLEDHFLFGRGIIDNKGPAI